MQQFYRSKDGYVFAADDQHINVNKLGTEFNLIGDEPVDQPEQFLSEDERAAKRAAKAKK